MDINKMIQIPNENHNLPPKVKEARDMFRYASIFFLVAALLYGLWGLWSIMRGMMWGWGFRIMQGIIYLIFGAVALVVKSKFEEVSIRPIDQGQVGTVKDNLVVYIILGFIFGWVLSGLLILLGYMKLDEIDTQANMCPECRGTMRFAQEYQRWYCDNCQDYKVPIHPANVAQPPPGQTPPPQQQQQPQEQQQQGWGQQQQQPQEQQQQQGWGQQQQQPQEQQQQQGWVQQKPQEQQQEQQQPSGPNNCPTCGAQGRWIGQYQRYYCDNCQKYL